MAPTTLTRAVMTVSLLIGMQSAAFATEKPKLMTGADAAMLGNTCAGCHGTNGASAGPASPTIAGLSKEYFVDTMKGFAEGDIPSTIMGRIAKGYTEEEYEKLADFYAGKPFVKAKQPFDAKLAKKGAKLHDKYCEKCHADGGSSAEDDAGVMAGQWTPYLSYTLADFIAGDRTPAKKMKKRLEKLLKRKGKAGIQALIAYYASQQK